MPAPWVEVGEARIVGIDLRVYHRLPHVRVRVWRGYLDLLPGREGLGEGQSCEASVLATNLRPPCSPPLQGGRPGGLPPLEVGEAMILGMPSTAIVEAAPGQ